MEGLTLIYDGTKSNLYLDTQDEGQPVVIKMLKEVDPAPHQLAYLQNEYALTHQLALECVRKAYRMGRFEDRPAIFLEHVPGASLKQAFVKEEKPFTDRLAVAVEVAKALEAIHGQGIIHRDFTSNNILIVPKPQGPTVKIIDFAFAVKQETKGDENTRPSSLEGTMAYISPEQTGRVNQAVDTRSDLYSFGVSLYELFTRRLPFEGKDPAELVHAHLATPPTPPEAIQGDIPHVLSELILRLLAKNPDARYQSASGLLADLQHCQKLLESEGEIHDFELGTKDLTGKLEFPEALYGRRKEFKHLIKSFDRVTLGTVELVMIKGYAGIGKSALVNAFRNRVGRKGGYFAMGHFDQLQSSVPYQGTNRAFGQLVRQLLTESSNRLEAWKKKILDAVGENGKLLIDVVPELQLIIGQQPDVPEVGATEAQNRLRYTFLNFIKALSDAQHPLVFFLDDCQWADGDSIDLIELLLTHPDNQYFWIITALRDNEIAADHPLLKAYDRLLDKGALVEQLEISNLSQDAVTELISATLRCGKADCQLLAELVYTKTQGNPFFVRQMLMSLYEKELLTFSQKDRRWIWDHNAIQQLNISDNVVELMAGKIQRLPAATQETLKKAACIGNQFAFSTLQAIHEVSDQELNAALTRAIDEGLVADLTDVNTAGEPSFSFTHDRIRQAVYSLISENITPALHLKIGRLVLEKLEKQKNEEALRDHIFDIVGQWNRGIDLVEGREEKRKLARLHHIAGQKANSAAAYKTALSYLQQGLDLLAAFGWENNYSLNHGLASEAMEAAFLEGNYSLLMELSQRLISQSVNLVDKVKAYELRTQALLAQNKLAEAVAEGLAFLKLLGISFPSNPREIDTRLAYLKSRWQLRGLSKEDIMRLPEMADPLKLAAMRVISVIEPPVHITQSYLPPLLAFKQVTLSIESGLSPNSAAAFIGYGVMLATRFGRIDKGYAYAEMGLALLERFQSESLKARTYYSFYSSLAPFQLHLRDCLPPLLEGFESGLNAGDLSNATFCIIQYVYYAYLSGTELSGLEAKLLQYIRDVAQRGRHIGLNYLNLALQVIQNLLHPCPKPYLLQGKAYTEEDMVEHHQLMHDHPGLYNLYLNKMILAYLFEAYEEGQQYATQASEIQEKAELIKGSHHWMYDALLCLARFPEARPRAQKVLMARVEECLDELSMLAEYAPTNHLHKYYLVEAEKHRVLGEEIIARELYEKAIRFAKEHEYMNEEALAWELTGKFFREQGHRFLAETHLLQAWKVYRSWGAAAKTAFLEQRYPHFIGRAVRKGSSSASSSTRSTSSTESLKGIDLESITKASIALSGEVVLSNLLEKMMQIAMENAGAERGAFIENQQGKLSVLAHGDAQSGIKVRERIPLEEASFLSPAIVNYVARTQKAIVLQHAAENEAYQQDAYIREHKPKSVLCYPIAHKGHLTGLIYLENNLTIGAFTQDRTEIFRLLSSQIAISFENARLYEHLDEKVRLRTKELDRKNRQLGATLGKLQSTQSQLVQSEKMASLGQLTAGIAHEINNPINFVTGNIGPLTRDIEDIKELLMKVKALETSTNISESLKEVKEFGEEIDTDFLFEEIEMLLTGMRDGANRTKEIVLGLKNFSRLDEQDFKMADVHDGIDSTLTLLNNKFKGRITVHKDYATIPRIECLPGKLNQVFMNLLNNALDAMPEIGEIFISTKEEEGEMLRISIRDTGAGMKEEVLEHIFEPFFTTKDVGAGTGLGLSISYGIIQQHKGEITATSTLGEGSEFIIRIPMKQLEG